MEELSQPCGHEELPGASSLGAPTIVAGQFTLTMRCPWCGQVGSSLWEETPTGRQLVRLNGFYERLAKKLPWTIETVCDACDRAQPT